jgi:hypothetical protein
VAGEQKHARKSDPGALPAIEPGGTELDSTGQPPADKSAPPDQTELQPAPERSSRWQVRRPLAEDALTLTQDDADQAAALSRSASEFSIAPNVPGYSPVEKLGHGTYGEVWLYEEVRTHIRVAVKFFRHGRSERWQQMQAEVRQLALLNADPGIMQLEDVEPLADPPYYIMRFAEGGSLLARLEGGKTVPMAEALRIFREAAHALAYVHAKGIRHCDLKPGNLLFDARGRALLADFGQAHLSDDASPALGTYFYMAPEQADLSAGIPDTRWDVYGLGALLYHMLTGKLPREDARLRAELDATVNVASRLKLYREAIRRLPRPTAHYRVRGMDRRLAQLIDRCLEIDPDKRLRDACDILDALDDRRRALRRRPVLLFSLIAPVLVLGALALLTHWALNDAVSSAGKTLTQQVQSSDLVNARLVANVVADQLDDRFRALRKLRDAAAMDEHVAEQHWAEVQRQLEGWLVRQQHEEDDGDELFSRLCVTDRQGHILADYPIDLPTRGPRWLWAWRDWFHGGGDRHDARDHLFEPLRVEHVSDPYISRIKGYPLAIVLTVPCFASPAADANRGKPREVVGLLTGLVEIKKVYKWIESVDLGEHGFAVLLNDRGHYLLHRDQEKIRPDLDRPPHVWTDEAPVLRRVLLEKEGVVDYEDPVDGERYLGGHTRFAAGNGTWAVVVQHRKQDALHPVESLRASVTTWGRSLVSAAIILVLGMWGWLIGLLRREERFGHG